MAIPEQIKQWETYGGVEFFHALGVKDGSTVLDFGFGKGHFAVAASFAVGSSGKVYALDCDAGALEALKLRIEDEHLSNIEVLDTHGRVKIALPDAAVDFVLCFDLLHHPGFDVDGLLAEARRLLRPGGALCVLPFHMDSAAKGRLADRIREAGFGEPLLASGTGPHFGMLDRVYQQNPEAEFDSVEKGTVYRFPKT